MSRLDRRELRIFPLRERKNDLRITEIAVTGEHPAPSLSEKHQLQTTRTAEHIIAARKGNKPVVLTYGAHLIKNGLGPLVAQMLERGWITHLATNGAGSIHDWEFAYQGESSEDVRANTAQGKFGIWEETNRFLNLAVAVGGIADLGYGGSVAKMIHEEGLTIPSVEEIRKELASLASQEEPDETLGALADLLYLVTTFNLPAGKMEIPHPFKKYSLQEAAWRLKTPFTVHPGIGYDIIYTHPLNCGGAIGRGAVRDFLAFADSISKLENGVHLAIGSSVMAPMIFEKAMSMANNLSLQRQGRPMSGHYLVINDIQEGGDWDWSKGEPPREHPAYYLRFCKSFYRMGGQLEYVCLDNRDFLLGLYHALAGY